MNPANKSIGWCDWTWNPIAGCKGPEGEGPCPYCFAHRFAERGMGPYGEYPKGERFRPRFFPERLAEPSKKQKPARIFCGSMGELFAPSVPIDWVQQVYGAMAECPQHTFVVLTKQPQWIISRLFGDSLSNVWHLVSCEDRDAVYKRVPPLLKLREHGWPVLGVSFEPLLGPIAWRTDGIRATDNLDWVIIGGQSPPSSPQPQREWVEDLTALSVACGIPVFQKTNLRAIMGNDLRQEWPERR